MEDGNSSSLREVRHDLKQPLNVIQLVSDQLRLRLSDKLDGADREFLKAKLTRIAEQVERANQMIDQLADAGAAPSGS